MSDTEFSYIDFVLSLKNIYLPKQFYILTSSVAYYDNCYVIDTSDIGYEFPEIKDRVIPLKKIEIRPNENKTFEIKIESIPIIRPQINLSEMNETTELSLNFPQHNILLDHDGIAYTFVNINASRSIPPQIYNIPIIINFTNPTFTSSPLLFTDAKIIYPTTTFGQSVDYLTIDVLPPLTDDEKFSICWNIYGELTTSIIGLIITALGVIIAVITGGWIVNYRLNRNRNDNK